MEYASCWDALLADGTCTNDGYAPTDEPLELPLIPRLWSGYFNRWTVAGDPVQGAAAWAGRAAAGAAGEGASGELFRARRLSTVRETLAPLN